MTTFQDMSLFVLLSCCVTLPLIILSFFFYKLQKYRKTLAVLNAFFLLALLCVYGFVFTTYLEDRKTYALHKDTISVNSNIILSLKKELAALELTVENLERRVRGIEYRANMNK
ncbi:MAG: hypothetical protein K5657_05905 [Desulfovibrio sp.]|nr:hypothetical protein [Desulfovibrio sp.]